VEVGPQFPEKELAFLENRFVACDLARVFPLREGDRTAWHMLKADVGRILRDIIRADIPPRGVRDISEACLYPLDRFIPIIKSIREKIPDFRGEVRIPPFSLGAGVAEIDKPRLEDDLGDLLDGLVDLAIEFDF